MIQAVCRLSEDIELMLGHRHHNAPSRDVGSKMDGNDYHLVRDGPRAHLACPIYPRPTGSYRHNRIRMCRRGVLWLTMVNVPTDLGHGLPIPCNTGPRGRSRPKVDQVPRGIPGQFPLYLKRRIDNQVGIAAFVGIVMGSIATYQHFYPSVPDETPKPPKSEISTEVLALMMIFQKICTLMVPGVYVSCCLVILVAAHSRSR